MEIELTDKETEIYRLVLWGYRKANGYHTEEQFLEHLIKKEYARCSKADQDEKEHCIEQFKSFCKEHYEKGSGKTIQLGNIENVEDEWSFLITVYDINASNQRYFLPFLIVQRRRKQKQDTNDRREFAQGLFDDEKKVYEEQNVLQYRDTQLDTLKSGVEIALHDGIIKSDNDYDNYFKYLIEAEDIRLAKYKGKTKEHREKRYKMQRSFKKFIYWNLRYSKRNFKRECTEIQLHIFKEDEALAEKLETVCAFYLFNNENLSTPQVLRYLNYKHELSRRMDEHDNRKRKVWNK